MKLYHGTNGEWINNILKNGIQPRKNHSARNNWRHVPHQSNRNCVYLTNSYAPYFAFNAEKGSCAVIEIETDLLNKNNLYPDEDCLEQVGKAVKDGVSGNMSQRTLYYRKHQFNNPITIRDRQFNWTDSLDFLGTCSFRGTVPSTAMTRLAKWPHKPNIWMIFVWDPTISILNQRICGNKYKALTAKLFGDPVPNLNEFDKQSVDNFDPSKIKGLEISKIL